MSDTTPDAAPARPAQANADEAAAGIQNLQQLIQLRWIAVAGQLLTIGVARDILHVPLPWQHMLGVVGCLALYNVVSLLRLRRASQVGSGELFLALLVDVTVLSVQLYLSGGAANPFIFLYLLQVALAAVLLRRRHLWTMVLVTGGCFAVLARHHLPLELPPGPPGGPPDLFVVGLLVCFVLNATLVAVFISRISRNLRERDARLAAAERRRMESEHIVRMGLLASGAAHELGTPLSTMAVILGDWRNAPRLRRDPALLDDIEEMEAQVQRCKHIVSSVLLSAGEVRGEASVQTTVRCFVDDVVREWRATRHLDAFAYVDRFGDDVPMVSDTTLRQMVFNVLDNAREASPAWVGLALAREADALCLTVTDAGPGFEPQILATLGEPYRSTRQRPGGGLGLYLVHNVVRRLGGTLQARNRPEGGAEVTIRLPLAAITLPAGPHATR
jgi:two-component system sensor histidine kinase RegB